MEKDGANNKRFALETVSEHAGCYFASTEEREAQNVDKGAGRKKTVDCRRAAFGGIGRGGFCATTN